MSLMLKIVEGPNKGAEIALPEGVAVTLGQSDSCDIVLADRTLPDEPFKLEASADAATLDGEPLELLTVVEKGATAFAVGPDKGQWGKLKWPRPEPVEEEKPVAPEPAQQEEKPEPSPEPAKRHGCLVSLLILLLVVCVLAAIGWFFREQLRPYADKARPELEQAWARAKPACRSAMDRTKLMFNRLGRKDAAQETAPEPGIEAVIERYGLVDSGEGERRVLMGDFSTRAERLAATAEAYAAQPGIELDFADDESLKAAVADTIALLGENDLRVKGVSKREAVLEGKAGNLRTALEAISADVPKLRRVDTAKVETSGMPVAPAASQVATAVPGKKTPVAASPSGKAPASVSLPVCGILTTPYPCIVLRNGMRIVEGAPFAGGTVVKIEADSVTLSVAGKEISWRP